MANQNWRKNIAALQLTSKVGLPQLSNNIQTQVMEFLTGKKTVPTINTPRKMMTQAKITHTLGKLRHTRELNEFILEQFQTALDETNRDAIRAGLRARELQQAGDDDIAASFEAEESDLHEQAAYLELALHDIQDTGRIPDQYVRWLLRRIESINETSPEEYQQAKADWLKSIRAMYDDVLAGGRRKTRKSKKVNKKQKSRRR